MAAAPIVVIDYSTFNSKLNQKVGQGSDSEVAVTMGRKLTNSGAYDHRNTSLTCNKTLRL